MVLILIPWSGIMFTVLVAVTCLLLNATSLLILIVGVLLTAMMLLSTAVSLYYRLTKFNKFNKNNLWTTCMTVIVLITIFIIIVYCFYVSKLGIIYSLSRCVNNNNCYYYFAPVVIKYCTLKQCKLCIAIVSLLFLQTPLGFGTVIHSLVWYVFKEETILMKDVWRSIVMDSGGQYAVLGLALLRLVLFASNWDMIVPSVIATYHCMVEIVIII